MGESASPQVAVTGDPEVDHLNSTNALSLVLGMMLDQQYGVEHAFRGGWKVLNRFGTLDPAAIAAADPDEFAALCSETPAIHRFPVSMAGRLQELAAHVAAHYDGDVARLWNEADSGKELLKRVQALPGFGKQKSRIFVALLAKQLGVRPAGWEAVAGDYALDGYRSVADIVDPDSFQKVRDYKRQKKAAAKPSEA
ncbi:putative HhH-GPD family protein [Actinoalloteichus hoggarensis]|nr:HhH-GPD-type base excision DNA repair protein [Actinoalloteichus hoggarensis]MBB5922373.1 putative HhH-GPD family protein [Actinoalloteichus hoggarensis]